MKVLKASWMLRSLPTARNLVPCKTVLGVEALGILHPKRIQQSARTASCCASAQDVQLQEDKKFRESQLEKLQCNYCRRCGSEMQICVPAGEDELRHQCSNCGYIEYHNPKTVVGCLVEHEGYMELHESSSEGACRETWEEACAKVRVLGPYAHLDIPIIGQTYMIFRAELAAPHTFAPGPESADVGLFAPDEIPFDSIAFSSISLTLKQWVEDKQRGLYTSMHGVIRKKPGASPRDPTAYKLTDVHQLEVGQCL